MSGRIVKKYVLVMTCKYCGVKQNADEFVKCVKRETICYDCFEHIPVGEMIYEKTPVAKLIAQKKTERTAEQPIAEEPEQPIAEEPEQPIAEEPTNEVLPVGERWILANDEYQKSKDDAEKMVKKFRRNHKPQECAICYEITKDLTLCHHSVCIGCQKKQRDISGQQGRTWMAFDCPICRYPNYHCGNAQQRRNGNWYSTKMYKDYVKDEYFRISEKYDLTLGLL